MTGHKNTPSRADNAETGIAHLPLPLTAILCQLALHDDLAKSALLDILHRIPLSDEERHWYEALRQQAVARLDSGGDDIKPLLQVLTEITRLRRFCCHPSLVLDNLPLAGSKLVTCLDIIDVLRENHHKALVQE